MFAVRSNRKARVRSRFARALFCVVALTFIAGGCKNGDEAASKTAVATEKPAPAKGPLVVFAASSLREGFEALGDVFEKEQGVTEISFNFAGTQQLRTQLEQGALADVFASADQRHMRELVSAGRVKDPRTFARNELVMVVDKKQEATLKSLEDLPKALRVVIGVPEVPVGKYALALFDNAGKRFGADFRARVEAHVVSRELNVRQVLSKVTLGEADACIVYRSDVVRAKDAVVVTIPRDLNVIAEYPIGVVADAPHANLAAKWVSLVLSENGSEILMKHGFLAVPDAQPSP